MPRPVGSVLTPTPATPVGNGGGIGGGNPLRSIPVIDDASNPGIGAIDGNGVMILEDNPNPP